jgi:hypothetical protein
MKNTVRVSITIWDEDETVQSSSFDTLYGKGGYETNVGAFGAAAGYAILAMASHWHGGPALAMLTLGSDTGISENINPLWAGKCEERFFAWMEEADAILEAMYSPSSQASLDT